MVQTTSSVDIQVTLPLRRARGSLRLKYADGFIRNPASKGVGLERGVGVSAEDEVPTRPLAGRLRCVALPAVYF